MEPQRKSLSREEMTELMVKWLEAWNEHDLDGVMELFHAEVLFENWTGARVKGKDRLYRAWAPWFKNQGGFRFLGEDFFFDEGEQKALFQWQLEWPSTESGHEAKLEIRRGVDVIHFQDGKIIQKLTYSKTKVDIVEKNE